MHHCSKCPAPATFKTNVLFYCDLCFSLLFEAKVRRAVPKLHNDSAVLVYFSDARLAAAAAKPLAKVLGNRRFKRLCVCATDAIETAGITECISTECIPIASISAEDTTPIESSRDNIVSYCIRHQFDTLIYTETLDRAMAVSLALLCRGHGMQAVSHCTNSIDGPLRIVNILEDIKDKEVSQYLKETNGTGEARDPGVTGIITEFIAEIDEKNELALFNVKNTFKKLGE